MFPYRIPMCAALHGGRVDPGRVQLVRGEPQRPRADPGQGHAPFGARAAARLHERGSAEVEGVQVGSVEN